MPPIVKLHKVTGERLLLLYMKCKQNIFYYIVRVN